MEYSHIFPTFDRSECGKYFVEYCQYNIVMELNSVMSMTIVNHNDNYVRFIISYKFRGLFVANSYYSCMHKLYITFFLFHIYLLVFLNVRFVCFFPSPLPLFSFPFHAIEENMMRAH